jgi:diadenylate cyclase
LEEIFRPLVNLFREPSWRSLIAVVDILIVTFLVYRLLLLARGTRTWRILLGIVLFVVLLFVSSQLRLNTLHWLLDKATLLAPVALVILLLPELRQALEGFGKVGGQIQKLVTVEQTAEARTVEEVVAASAEMSAQRIGALIVIERTAHLNEIVTSGVMINASVSSPLLVSIFYEGNPLHDGAVILRGDTIVAAACRLPLSETSRLSTDLHMRHRAAVGVSEAFDCIVVVVSEERGTISVVKEGRLRRLSNHVELREYLNKELRLFVRSKVMR